jgi:hypothetical protein
MIRFDFSGCMEESFRVSAEDYAGKWGTVKEKSAAADIMSG